MWNASCVWGLISKKGILESSSQWLMSPASHRPICGIITKRWCPGWRGSWLKRRGPGLWSTRTSSASAETTSSSRSAGDSPQPFRFKMSTDYVPPLISFLLLFPASFKPIPRLPWIPSCTWLSTFRPRREPRWSASCPPWRRRPPLEGGGGLSSLRLADALLGPPPQPDPAPGRGPRVWRSQREGHLAAAGTPDEPLAMILNKQELGQLTNTEHVVQISPANVSHVHSINLCFLIQEQFKKKKKEAKEIKTNNLPRSTRGLNTTIHLYVVVIWQWFVTYAC